MMKLEIRTTNAAFDDGNRGPELARILRDIADNLAEAGDCADGIEAALHDMNGNRVGGYTITETDGL